MELQLKICLFNTENLFLVDPPQGDVYKKPIEKTEWIARTLNEINADIIMLLEVGGNLSFDYFNSKYLSDKYFTAMLKGNSDRGIEMGYLIKKTFPYTHSILSHANDSIEFNYPFEIIENNKLGEIKYRPHKFSRDVSELRIFKDNHVALIILLVHLKSKWDRDGVDFNGSMRRKAELKALIKTYNKLNEDFHYNVPIIVAGDMNGIAQKGNHESEFDDLYNFSDLEDVLEVINLPHEQRISFLYFGKDNKREAGQLDYIFLPKSLQKAVKKEESGIYLFRDNYGTPLTYPQESYQRYALPSDHYPVVANLDFL